MGCDARIILPGNVRIRDVMRVIGVAVGFEAKVSPLGSSICTDVDGVEATTPMASSPDFLHIKFDNRHAYWSFEPDCAPGKRLLMPTSSAFWCLVGHRLVDFFGGKIDYNDCDAIDFDYERRPKGNSLNCPDDGEPWRRFHERIAKVPPITRAELEAFRGAAYDFKSDDYQYFFDAEGRMVRGDRALALLAEAA